jgi:hypothetical protein
MALKFVTTLKQTGEEPGLADENPSTATSPEQGSGDAEKYIKPEQVLSPKDRVLKVQKVLYDGGPKSLAVAVLDYVDEDGTHSPDAIAIRWNGGGGNALGFPSVRQFPVWFIVPPELASTIRFLAQESFQYQLPFSQANAERFMALCGHQFSTESLAKNLKSRGFKVNLEF